MKKMTKKVKNINFPSFSVSPYTKNLSKKQRPLYRIQIKSSNLQKIMLEKTALQEDGYFIKNFTFFNAFFVVG